jgi:hypothetical protein
MKKGKKISSDQLEAGRYALPAVKGLVVGKARDLFQ